MGVDARGRDVASSHYRLIAASLCQLFYRFASRKINLGTSCLTFFMRFAREINVGASHNRGRFNINIVQLYTPANLHI